MTMPKAPMKFQGESDFSYAQRWAQMAYASGRADAEAEWAREGGYPDPYKRTPPPPAPAYVDMPRTWDHSRYSASRCEREVRKLVREGHLGTVYRARNKNQLLQIDAYGCSINYNVRLQRVTGKYHRGGSGNGYTLFTEASRDLDREPWYRCVMDLLFKPYTAAELKALNDHAYHGGEDDGF